MSRTRAMTAADIHPHECDCASCEPYLAVQADRASAADCFGMLTTAGVGAGLVLCWIVDRLIGGPGISVIFGA